MRALAGIYKQTQAWEELVETLHRLIEIGTTATVDGPLDGSTVILGQSSTSTFNGYTFVPVGMPGNPTIFALTQTPQVTGG